MNTIRANDLIRPLADGILHALTHVDPSVLALLRAARDTETGAARWALDQLLENADYAAATDSPACQDTGLAVFFVELGRRAHVEGDLDAALDEAVRRAYTDGRCRMSVVRSPLDRVNTGDNTPAVVHYSFFDGDTIRISYLAKGAGSENMSLLKLLPPSKGRAGIIDACVECVRTAGANPCPPVLLGVGVGGNFEQVALLSKRALLRPCGAPSPDPTVAALEADILAAVNALGIGPQGFGGHTTALAVAVETAPTHIGMLPVAINLQCHSVRHFTIESGGEHV